MTGSIRHLRPLARSAVIALAAPATLALTWADGFSAILLAASGHALTHAYRGVIPRGSWTQMSVLRWLPRVLAACLLISLVLNVKDGDRCWLIRMGDVRLLESEGNYTRLFFGSEQPLIARSLRYLEERLDPERFFRASRRHIVNLSAIESLDPEPGGGFWLKLEGGHELEMSRRQARLFREQKRL